MEGAKTSDGGGVLRAVIREPGGLYFSRDAGSSVEVVVSDAEAAGPGAGERAGARIRGRRVGVWLEDPASDLEPHVDVCDELRAVEAGFEVEA